MELGQLSLFSKDSYPSVVAAGVHARWRLQQNAAALAQADRAHRHPWARASAAEAAGTVLVQLGDRDRAVAQLEKALDGYRQVGTDHDERRVLSKLRGLGVRRQHWTYADRPTCGWASLTDTQRVVADLVAQGLTNREVAARMFLSPHTVVFHLRQIFRKLDVHSRVALTRLIVERNTADGTDAEHRRSSAA